MAELIWSVQEERTFERGLDHGVLYHLVGGAYTNGEVWNGLTTVTEAPSGGEATKQYADNMVYATLTSAEEFGATIEAFTAPRNFFQYDGIRKIGGMQIGQQARGLFGFSYRTLLGNAEQEEAGYALHLVYGGQVAPSEKSRTTTNDSPELSAFSWTLTTNPVAVTGFRPTAYVKIESTDPLVSAAALKDLEDILYGRLGGIPRMPMPDEVASILSGSITSLRPTEPTENSATSVTIPTQTGVRYYIDNVLQTAGNKTISGPTVVEARPGPGVVFTSPYVDRWYFPGA